MTRAEELACLAELFSIAFEREGTMEAAMGVVLDAHDAGETAVVHAEAYKRRAARVVDEIAVRRCQRIIAEVALAADLTSADLTGRARRYRITRARHEAQWRCVEANVPLELLAEMFNVSHQAVSAGAAAHEARTRKAAAEFLAPIEEERHGR
jgi:hypothetical protein